MTSRFTRRARTTASCKENHGLDFLNAGVSLVDVPEGNGFVCLPGSHKRNFTPKLSIYDGPPTVINVPVSAGDAVIFTEALMHGARRWTLTRLATPFSIVT